MKMTMKISVRTFTVLTLLAASILVTPSASAWNDGASIAVSTFGGTLREEVRSMALDGDGNIYRTGYFRGAVDFNPGEELANLTSAGGTDIFILKSDPNGNFLWVKRIGGINAEAAAAIAIDRSGGVVITGNFGGGGGGTVDFDPGVGVDNLTSSGDDDIFVLKIDSSGNHLWAKSMGGLERDTGVYIAVDIDGNIGATGIFNSAADFDPTQETDNRTSAGDWDVFISKFDSSGNHLWTKTRGGPGREVGQGIAFDSGGNIFSLGYFNSTVDFDPSDDGVANLTSAGDNDMFISKFDSSGRLLWAKRIGSTGSDGAAQVAFDRSGSLYFTGYFSGTVDFDPHDDRVAEITSTVRGEMFVSKFDSSGNFLWAKRRGGTGADRGLNIALDRDGNIYSTGYFSGTVDFDPSDDGVTELTSDGDIDIFIAKFDSSGRHLWAKRIGGNGSDRGLNIAVDTSGKVFTSGFFSNTVDFDPGIGTSNFTSNGDFDIFTLKLDPNGNAPLVAVVSAGAEENSKVSTIPSGITEAAIAKSTFLPAIKLNFGGTAPTAVTVKPIANPAPSSVTPFSTSNSPKIVDIVLDGAFSGSVTLCLDGGSADRLYHYKNSAWVELGSRSYVNGQVCGVTTSFSPFVAAPVAAPVYVAPTPKPYLKTLTLPKLNLKEGKLVCTPGTYNAGYTLDGVIQGSSAAIFSPSSYIYNLLINGVAQTSKVVSSDSTSTSWEMQAIPSGSLVACSVTVNANSLTNTDKSSDNTAAVSSALTTQSQAIKAVEAAYSETVSVNSKSYQKALVDNRATWRKEIEVIQNNYYEALNRIKAKGGPKASSETSAALKLRIAASKKSAADYAASKPAALAAKDAANKAALDAKTAAIAKANLNYGNFIESIGYGVLIP
jgi:hypothetical protein